MHKNKPAEAELIPSPDMILRSGVDKATLDRLVQQRVAEIMAERDAVVFEPFFRSRQIAYELKRLQTMPEQRKWTVFFDRYGCLVCETRKRIHVGNGMCTQCYARTYKSSRKRSPGMPHVLRVALYCPLSLRRLRGCCRRTVPEARYTDAGTSDARGKAHKSLLSSGDTL